MRPPIYSAEAATIITPPLSVYIHLPWCIKKCPYCDFNSFGLPASEALPEKRYLEALVRDLESELPGVWGRPVTSVFFGGGTPSLFSPDTLADLLSTLRARLPLRPDTEITLEANPGTAESDRFRGFRDAGVNRLSLGIQSFSRDALVRLGRVHDERQALQAVAVAQAAGFQEINLDLMFGLPGQSIRAGLDDLRLAISLGPTHISWYQLTLEPNTVFAARPPPLPDDDEINDLFSQGLAILEQAGYERYEISAYARSGSQCQHNRNYWEFGDYLGLGAGAHGKLTLPAENTIQRTIKPRQPEAYMRTPLAESISTVHPSQRPFEFMLNALRLVYGVPSTSFIERTGIPLAAIESVLNHAHASGLLAREEDRLRATEQGLWFLNDLVASFLPDPETSEASRAQTTPPENENAGH
jgi:putative oxygen-independent coproporphyrinogen III oxidase